MSDDGTTSLIALWNLALKQYKDTVNVDLSSYSKLDGSTGPFELLESRLEESAAFRKQDLDESLHPVLHHLHKFWFLGSSEVEPVFDPATDVVKAISVLIDVALRSTKAYEFVIERLNEVKEVFATLEIEPELKTDTPPPRRKFLQILIDLLECLMLKKTSRLKKHLPIKPQLAKPGALDALRRSVEAAHTIELSNDSSERRLQKLWGRSIQQFRSVTKIDLAAAHPTLGADSPDALLAVLPGRLGVEPRDIVKLSDALNSILETISKVIGLAPLAVPKFEPLVAILAAVDRLLRTTIKVAYDDTNEFFNDVNKSLGALKSKLVYYLPSSNLSPGLKNILAEVPLKIFELFAQVIQSFTEKPKRTLFHRDDKVRGIVSEIQWTSAKVVLLSWDSYKSSHRAVQLSEIWVLALREYRMKTHRIFLASAALDIDSAGRLTTYLTENHDAFTSYRDEGRTMREIVVPVLEVLEKFSSVASQTASSAFPPSASIFAGIQSLFDNAKKVTENYDNLTAMFEQLNGFTRRLEVYQGHNVSPELRRILVKILVQLLIVLELASKAMDDGRAVSFLKAAVVQNDDIQKAIQELGKHVDEERGMAVTLNLGLTSKIFDMAIDREIVELGNWLSPHYFGVPQDVIDRRTPGTGAWVIEREEFKDWVHGKIQVLFCPGPPGAGKTFVTSRVLTHLEELDNVKRKNDAVAQIYFHYKNHAIQTTRNLLADLLKQLIKGCDPSSSRISDLKALRLKHGHTSPSISELVGTLKSMVCAYSTVFIVIDALDEASDNGTREEFMEQLHSLAPKVRLMVTSRVLPHIEDLFRRPGTAWIPISPSTDDIKAYVEQELEKRRYPKLCDIIDPRSELRQAVIDTVVTTAKDMFLLARMHLILLGTKLNASDVRKCLEKLPSTPGDAYADTKERIEELHPDHADLAKSMLAWITFANRSLSLEELQIALAIPEDSALTEMNEEYYTPGNTLMELSLGLVVIDEEYGTIRFVHETAQEYFEKENPPLPNFEATIATTCLRYLAFHRGKGSFSHGSTLKSTLNDKPLLGYAAHSWGLHALKVQELIEDTATSILFKAQEGQFGAHGETTSLWPYDPENWWEHATTWPALHLCAQFGLETFVKAALDSGEDGDSKDADGRSPMSHAAEKGHDLVVQVLLRREEISMDSGTKHGRTPLSYAAQWDHTSIVELLLKHGSIAVDSADNEGRTPLSYAAEWDRVAVVELLLKHGSIVVDSADVGGRTPLSYAAQRGCTAIVELLLKHGSIAVDSADNEGRTPLSYAAQGVEVLVVELLKHGSNAVNSTDNEGRTPLSYAAERDRPVAVVELLLKHGSNAVDSTDNEGRTPLSYAAEWERVAVVELLLKHGSIVVDSADMEGRTPLSYAAQRGCTAIVELLLKHGSIAVDSADVEGRTPLSYAAKRGSAAVVELLLEHSSIDVDSADKEGRTPLSYGARSGSTSVVELLLSDGSIAVDSPDNKGRTPLSYAAQWDHTAVVNLLLKQGSIAVDFADNEGRTSLSYAAESGCTAVVELLLTHCSVAVDSADNEGRTPLSHAAEWDQVAVIELLLKHGSIAIDSADNEGRTPLSHAAEWDRVPVVKLLIKHGGISVDSVDNGGLMPLSHAARRCYAAVVELLLKHGSIAVDSPDNEGRTPLSYAAELNGTAMVELLLKQGSILVNAADNDGLTPLFYAVQASSTEVIDILLQFNGINVNAKDKTGRTPISYVHRYLFSGERIVQALLDHGAIEMDLVNEDVAISLAMSDSEDSSAL